MRRLIYKSLFRIWANWLTRKINKSCSKTQKKCRWTSASHPLIRIPQLRPLKAECKPKRTTILKWEKRHQISTRLDKKWETNKKQISHAIWSEDLKLLTTVIALTNSIKSYWPKFCLTSDFVSFLFTFQLLFIKISYERSFQSVFLAKLKEGRFLSP